MKISTSGAICLFGEHQNYLCLPVIAAARSRRVGYLFVYAPIHAQEVVAAITKTGRKRYIITEDSGTREETD